MLSKVKHVRKVSLKSKRLNHSHFVPCTRALYHVKIQSIYSSEGLRALSVFTKTFVTTSLFSPYLVPQKEASFWTQQNPRVGPVRHGAHCCWWDGHWVCGSKHQTGTVLLPVCVTSLMIFKQNFADLPCSQYVVLTLPDSWSHYTVTSTKFVKYAQ